MNAHTAEKDVRCDGHCGAGSLREWAECPLCNPGESSVLPPEVTGERCPECRHMPHGSLGFCPNMASDNECSCTYVTSPGVGA